MDRNPIAPDAGKVAVIVTGTLGEAVLATAPLKAIRAHHAGAQITLFTDPELVRLFRHCPFVDAVEARWRPAGLGDELKARWALWTWGLTVVYDLSATPQTNALYDRFAPFRPLWSGTARGCSHPHVDRGRARLHRLDRHAEQLGLCGIGPADGYPPGAAPLADLAWIGADPEEARRITPARQGLASAYALLAPEGPQDQPGKCWPVERYGALATALKAQGLRPVIVGSPAATEMGAAIRAMEPDALDLVAKLDVFQFVGLARGAALAVGGEGDLTVVAAAAGAPTVAILNPAATNLRQAAPRGPATVALVSRSFAGIAGEQVLRAARAVMPAAADAPPSAAA
jgi:ADP-heptose:LPS heptosyltransferase